MCCICIYARRAVTQQDVVVYGIAHIVTEHVLTLIFVHVHGNGNIIITMCVAAAPTFSSAQCALYTTYNCRNHILTHAVDFHYIAHILELLSNYIDSCSFSCNSNNYYHTIIIVDPLTVRGGLFRGRGTRDLSLVPRLSFPPWISLIQFT